jgi:hypothetical protein
MKTYLSIAAAAFFLTGCGTQTFLYKSSEAESKRGEYNVVVRAKQSHEPKFLGPETKTEASLYVNNTLALKGALDNNFHGLIVGQYEGKALTLECSRPSIFQEPQCTVQLGDRIISETKLKLSL